MGHESIIIPFVLAVNSKHTIFGDTQKTLSAVVPQIRQCFPSIESVLTLSRLQITMYKKADIVRLGGRIVRSPR